MSKSLLVCVLCWCAGLSSLQAATFTVNSGIDLVDVSPGDGVCSVGPVVPGNPCTLRAAVMEAEANAEADTINIQPGLVINLTLAGVGDVEVGDLNIETDIVIAGFSGEPPGNPALLPLIDASALGERHFSFLGGEVTLRGLRLRRGFSPTSGGALRVSGDASVRVEHSQLLENTAAARGGAILTSGPSTLVVEDSLFFRNDGGTASGGAIAVQGTPVNGTNRVTVRRSSFLDNRASDGLGSSIVVFGEGSLRIEDSTIDGSLLRPPVAGLEARTGIVQFSPSELILRNVTISNFSQNAVSLRNLDGNERTRIANSVLDSAENACSASGGNLAAANVQIAYSLLPHQLNCQPFYVEGVLTGVADLGPLSDDPPPRFTVSRPPSGPLANVVDRGAETDDPPADPDLLCTGSDQRGNPRPVDADLDGMARCDLGAIEQAPPTPFVVNHFANDLTDNLPGDGQCASALTPGIGSVCTLRAAVMEANALAGLQYIRFAPSPLPAVLTLLPAGPIGGALQITDAVAIEGNLDNGLPATTIAAQMPGQRLMVVQSTDQAVHLRNLRLQGGDAQGQVGGALVVASGQTSLDRTEVFDNFAGTGGGAIALVGGSLSVTRSDFHGNSTNNAGAAIFSNGGTLGISASSFRNHFGVRANGTPIPAIQLFPGTRAFVSDVTFSGNQLGIEADRADLLLLSQLTLFEQINGGLRIELAVGDELYLDNSIIAAPTSAVFDCQISGIALAAVAQIDGILDSDGSCATLANQGITADPLLEALQRPSGEVSFHHPPRAQTPNPSPAIDRAAAASCTGRFDQYRRVRPIDIGEIANALGPCDFGAIESVDERIFADGFE